MAMAGPRVTLLSLDDKQPLSANLQPEGEPDAVEKPPNLRLLLPEVSAFSASKVCWAPAKHDKGWIIIAEVCGDDTGWGLMKPILIIYLLLARFSPSPVSISAAIWVPVPQQSSSIAASYIEFAPFR